VLKQSTLTTAPLFGIQEVSSNGVTVDMNKLIAESCGQGSCGKKEESKCGKDHKCGSHQCGKKD